MTKKIFAMFLAVLMVVSMLPTSVFAANATCPGKGSDKHTLENCTYTVVKVTPPTCGTKGFTTYQCEVCKDVFTESWVDATGEHELIELPALAPTCAKNGYEAGVQCANCPYKVPGAVIPQLGDGLTDECEWVDKTPHINCEVGGTKRYECVACGAVYEEVIEAGKHNWNEDAPVVKDGNAFVVCTRCGETKAVDFIDGHWHVWIKRDRVEPSCFEEGVMAHRECRICGQLQIQYEHDDYGWGWYNTESVVLARKHHFDCPDSCNFVKEHDGDHEATCVDAELHCNVCDGYYDVSEEHVFTQWSIADDGQPTCTKPGYEISYCDNCLIAINTRIVKKLGHLDVTINVPATCYTYAYSYTVCMRGDDCDRSFKFNTKKYEDVISDMADYPMEMEQYAPITDWVENDILSTKGFYLASNQKDYGAPVYFNGQMNGYYLDTTYDITQAVRVFVEIVHPLLNEKIDAYRLYFKNEEGVKTYIEIYEYINSYGTVKPGVQLTTTKPETYFVLDHATGVLTASFEQKDGSVNEYFLCNYTNKGNVYTTFGASDYDRFINSKTTYRAHLCETDVFDVVNFNLINATIDVDGGLDENNHDYQSIGGEWDTSDCTAEGFDLLGCPNCDTPDVQVNGVTGHSWEYFEDTEFVEVGGKMIPAVKYDPCEGGYVYKQCSVCLTIEKEDTTIWGHWWGDLIDETPNHMPDNRVVYDHYICLCGDRMNVQRETWDSYSYFESEAKFEEAHSGSDLIYTKRNHIRTSCTTKLYDTAECADCGKKVYIWIKGTGDHTLKENTPGYQEPKCLIPGGYFTYNCEVCNAVIGNAALGEWNVLAATGHSWKENEKYKAADCNNPNFVEEWELINDEWHPVFNEYGPFTHSCKNCNIGLTDGTEKKSQASVNVYQELCTKGTFLYYNCHCGKEHIYNYVPALGHKQVELDRYEKNADGSFKKDANGQLIIIEANYQPATCEATGWYKTQCVYCGNVETETIPMLAHVNKAGETFWNSCMDTVTDRHCVNCCVCEKEGMDHKCDATTDKNGNKREVCDCVIPTDCNYTHIDNYASTCVQDAYTLKICGDCGTHTMITWDDSKWNGHRPTTNYEWFEERLVLDENDMPVIGEDGFYVYETVKLPAALPMYLDNYIYKDYTWVSVKTDANDNFYNDDTHPWLTNTVTIVDENGVEVEVEVPATSYTAKFIEYVPADYVNDGYWVGYCDDCKQIVKQIIPKKDGLGFEVDVNNANGAEIVPGVAESTFGSEIEVILYANSNGEGIYSFDLNLDYVDNTLSTGFLFIGFEEMNDNFQFAVTNAENANGKINIKAWTVRDSNGLMQNIAITERTPLVKLVFRSVDKSIGEFKFVVNEDEAKAYKYVPNKGPAEFYCDKGEDTIVNRGLLNFNNDREADIVDMLQAMTMLTGEHAYGKTYDVTVDLNKDGQISLEEISLGYQKMVGNFTDWDLFFMGMDAEQVTMIMELLGIRTYAHHCVNKDCPYASDYPFVICPICYTVQANG